MAGRKPKTSIDLDKNHMSKQELQDRKDATPVYERQDFIPPEGLSKEELKNWQWLTGIFRETRDCAVSDADAHLMELYCIAKAAADEANRQIRLNPNPNILVATGYDKDGKPKTTSKPNPWYKIRREESALCLKLFDQLGLTPIARAKMGVARTNKKKDDEVWRKLLDRSDD